MTTTILNIEGMNCQNCVRHVTHALQDLPGVQEVTIDLSQQQARVQSTQALSEAQWRTAIEEAGYALKQVST